jgi:hypothetical protein
MEATGIAMVVRERHREPPSVATLRAFDGKSGRRADSIRAAPYRNAGGYPQVLPRHTSSPNQGDAMSEPAYFVREEPGQMGLKDIVVRSKSGRHKCSCVLRKDADEIAAALNAAEQRDAERKLLEEAAAIMREPASQIRKMDWLAEYAALQTEGKDG